ncbi:hypothetical protein QBC47DRAFT_352458 [Echria macrotheca]|uniref:Uncharacterized protein n=1 Tax=Echria macrotheca TaxID=438768 RepID=A0AAJ0B3B4_9PEZI|nr:hypothetical protein QBC47DRAFT_352458 [Echria macrotheca]
MDSPSPSTPFVKSSYEQHEVTLDIPSSSSDEESLLPKTRHQPNPPPPKRHRYLTTIFNLTIYALALYGLLSLLLLPFLPRQPLSPSPPPVPDVYRPSTLPPTLNLCNCGSNPAEALRLNCTYDTLAAAWLPPTCRDPVLTAQFDASGPGPNASWSYFLDAQAQIPIPPSELGSLGGTHTKFWTSRRWHVAHCLFYWQKLWRMRETGTVMEERFDSLEHIRHCTRLILNHIPPLDLSGTTGEKGEVFLLDVPVMMNASTEAAKRASREGHHVHSE